MDINTIIILCLLLVMIFMILKHVNVDVYNYPSQNGNCSETKFGCCPDGKNSKIDFYGTNCPRYNPGPGYLSGPPPPVPPPVPSPFPPPVPQPTPQPQPYLTSQPQEYPPTTATTTAATTAASSQPPPPPPPPQTSASYLPPPQPSSTAYTSPPPPPPPQTTESYSSLEPGPRPAKAAGSLGTSYRL